jgi:hypothetical protein
MVGWKRILARGLQTPQREVVGFGGRIGGLNGLLVDRTYRSV